MRIRTIDRDTRFLRFCKREHPDEHVGLEMYVAWRKSVWKKIKYVLIASLELLKMENNFALSFNLKLIAGVNVSFSRRSKNEKSI
jgi:hypothetical protein